MDQLLNVMIETARDAGKIILEAGKEQIGIKTKSSFRDVVTKYDVQIQAFAEERLKSSFPDAGFVAEEDEEDKKSQKSEPADAAPSGQMVFVIDPIDGTANFSHHYQHSCISIGCVQGQEPVAGVVYDPFLDEMFTAEKGKGAFLNGQPLTIPPHSLEEVIVLFGSAPYNMELAEETFGNGRKIFGKCQDIRRSGSAALDLCYVAAGRAGMFFESILSVWDYAAGALMVQEAGGICMSMKGEPLVFDRPAKSSVIAGRAELLNESGLIQ